MPEQSQMFSKILIANRGEIACRIMRTARDMGVRTVAVYSDADATAMHVQMADQAVRIGPAAVADSYLRGDLIIKAAKDTGAQAIHPGYGFLSENPDFVAAVEDAGLVFIGPSADAIRAMGLKDAAKDLMAKAGVPVVPGYQGVNQDAGHLATEADKIGYPVLIKAVAGGGGKGMRLVETADAFQEALESAKAEARTAFGNDHVLIEKYILNPRHIEVQVFGDGENALHLFERDCSLQRRHQKVIEEAPAPGMTTEVRAAMGQAAVRAAEAIGYAGAGTVEFIVDGSDGLRADGFWFMEMNTRLQVEHPVTEMITGVDLVAWQLQVAAGQGLPCRQDDLAINGHAFEARIYAEDVPAGFLPATGGITHLKFPTNARIDTGVVAGDEISPWYDPMIAKLTVHGKGRESALRELSQALDAVELAGSVTNLGFLQRLSRQTDFVAGEVETGLIGTHQASLTSRVVVDDATLIYAAMVATGLDAADQPHRGFTLWDPLAQDVTLIIGGDELTVRLALCGDAGSGWSGERQIDIQRNGDGWRVGGRRMPRALKHDLQVTIFGRDPVSFTLPDPLERGDAQTGGDTILAPMPGLVRDVAIKPGDTVEAGQRLVVLEAMKMEHVLRAPRDGVISNVTIAIESQVAAGDVLVALEPEL